MALQFASPRFAGDPVLVEILNDPDTGTKKLQPGSPVGSVTRLQEALFELGWTVRIDPPIIIESDFVVGNYGPRTTQTVLAYKTHYDIHFPPSAPTGLIDGLAGPRTFAKLDPQCVLLDEAIAAIRAKVADLAAAGTPVEVYPSSVFTSPIDDTSGTWTSAKIAGADGAIFYKRGVGAFEVHGNIYDSYLAAGFAPGPWGFPISDEYADADPWLRTSEFEHGSMRCNVDTGEVQQVGPDSAATEVTIF